MFVSYSHGDRELVAKAAADLSKAGIRVWWDSWEMQPGDILRDRVNDGIAKANAYLVIMSPSSITSSWVKYEINTAFIHTMEDQGVRIIPALTGSIDYSDLPPDFRMRYCLDFRDEDLYVKSIAALIDFIKPAERISRERRERLRNPLNYDISIKELRAAALTGDDQLIQRAALRGAVTLNSPDSVRICAVRSINMWGVGAIETSISCLAQLSKVGGLLALTATLLWDIREISERYDAILRGLARIGDSSSSTLVESAVSMRGGNWELISWAPRSVEILRNCENEDIRYGAEFMVRNAPLFPGLSEANLASASLESVNDYFKNRVPGLYVELFKAMIRERKP
jgi:hypothetical protein